ncbi:MAG: hypothetical protein LUG46_03425 [Erysipelotrichaceae bacterium]|nr:hypothetical protein [Erysipelotrichaceae bacterium]
MTSPAAKYVIATAIVVGGSVGGYSVYNIMIQNDITISLLSDAGVSCTFYGYSGTGRVNEANFDYTSIEYDETDEDVTNFLKTIRLSYDDSETLSDGDTLTVTAMYNEERAEELNLDIENDTYDVTVDLPTLYSSPEDIPDDIVTAAKERIENYMATSYMGIESLYSYSYTVTYEPYSTWFCYDGENLMNHIMVVYEVIYHYNEGGSKRSYWYAYVAQNIASNYFDYEDEVGCYASPIYEAFENGSEMIDDPTLIAEKLPLFWADTMVFTQFDD